MFFKSQDLPIGMMPKKYSVNLMWINRTLNPDQEYIGKEKSVITLVESAIKWKKAHPDGQINIWYDGLLTSEESVKKTRVLLEEQGNIGINFKDIRDIPIVSSNPDIFSEQMPHYFRIDLLKLIICLYELERQSCDCSIFTDISVQQLEKEKLFDESSMKKLEQYGMLTNGAENQFIQIINEPGIIESVKHMVNVNLMRAVYALNMPEDEVKKQRMSKLYVSPYLCTRHEIHKYHLAVKSGSIKINSDLLNVGQEGIGWIKYDINEHGYVPFGEIYDHDSQSFWNSNSRDGEPVPNGDVLRFNNGEGGEISSEDYSQAYRRDIKVRSGNSHDDLWELTKQPEDGSSTFKCIFWEKENELNERLMY